MSDAVQRAVEALERGELVAFPTETVYGLGADATNPEALQRLFRAKGRPADHPVIVHLGDPDWLERYSHPSEAARALVRVFWPGPLTLILPRSELVCDRVTGGQDTVGLRMPAHPLSLELIRGFGRGVAAPSANRFGHVSPTTAEHVRQEFGDEVAVILDGGPCQVGVESTILDLSSAIPRLLRPGGITPTQLADVLGTPPAPTSSQAPRAPGSLKSHYAPRTPCRLMSPQELDGELARDRRVAVLSRRLDPGLGPLWLQAPADPADYARTLYANLRLLDCLAPDEILVEDVPRNEDWLAVRDRLVRATTATSDPRR